MMTQRQSFLVSLTLHLAVVLVLLITGALLARRFIGHRPIELDLQAPVPPAPEQNAGPPQQEKPTEPEPTITEHVISEPTFDPSKSLDVTNIPDVPKEDIVPWNPKPRNESGSGNPATDYGRLIVAVCKRNWSPPARGVLARPLPTTDVDITVARDGRILDYRIVRGSGNAAFDRSVLDAIRLSNPLPAFPRELSGSQQTFPITFELEH